MFLTLTTYPRSGQHFLREHIIQRFSLENFKYTHEEEKNKGCTTITITRNPLESISSWVAMQNHYDKETDYFKIINNIKICKAKYNKFYKYILSNVNIIIDYNYLNSNTEDIIQYIGQKINIIPNKNNVILNIKDESDKKHIVSSKKNKEYDLILNITNQINLDEEFELYNKTLKKAYPNFTSDVF